MTRSAPTPPVPEGAMADPIEPTDDAVRTAVAFALRTTISGDYRWPDYMRDLYRLMAGHPSMRRASPPPETAPASQGVEAMIEAIGHAIYQSTDKWMNLPRLKAILATIRPVIERHLDAPASADAPARGVETEQRARQIAADKMGLVKDPRGERLPDDLWRQCLPQAQSEAALAATKPQETGAQWRPIAEMPTDGTPFLGRHPRQPNPFVCWWSTSLLSGKPYICIMGVGEIFEPRAFPTVGMLIPPVPAASTGSKTDA